MSQKCFEMHEKLGTEKVPAVLCGKDLIDAGYKPGPIFGQALGAAYEHQLEYPETEEEQLMEIAVQVLTK